MVSFKMVGIKPKDVPHIGEAMNRGIGPSSFDEVEVLGDLPTNVKFRLPYTILTRMACRVGSLAPSASPFPYASAKCTRCGTCAVACPATAITLKDLAVVDKSKCIKCYVCHEVCEYDAMLVQKHRIM
jgi:NAD-dependent dihydropyrimidine dehydrogenase PreA subunit